MRGNGDWQKRREKLPLALLLRDARAGLTATQIAQKFGCSVPLVSQKAALYKITLAVKVFPERPCPTCEMYFAPVTANQKFCSPGCRDMFSQREKEIETNDD